MKISKKSILWAGCSVAALCGVLGGVALAQEQEKEEAPVGLAAPLLIKAINAANQAKAGNITEVDVEREDGRIQVEVDISTIEGQRYEVIVEAESSKVLSVENDDDTEEGTDKEEKEKEQNSVPTNR